jgi:transketolase
MKSFKITTDCSEINYKYLKDISNEIRLELLKMSYTGKAPHLGSSLSCVEILVAAYWGALNINPKDACNPLRDRLILSKGHAATTLYACLAHKGFFDRCELDSFAKDGKNLPEHPGPGCATGVEFATGSLGHGLSVGIGMALSGKIMKRDFKVFVIMSDGECNEGSVWEAAMFAPVHHLDNLLAVVDYNKWQATGRSNEVMSLNPLVDKWRAFGWDADEIDGHDLEQLVLKYRAENKTQKPTVLVAHTIKGKGVSFMEDDNNWHYRIPSFEEFEKAKRELGFI